MALSLDEINPGDYVVWVQRERSWSRLALGGKVVDRVPCIVLEKPWANGASMLLFNLRLTHDFRENAPELERMHALEQLAWQAGV